jgi:uncharacterized protein (DUF983 family)
VVHERAKGAGKDMDGLRGICPTCGAGYCGWALLDPDNQKCDRCGSTLEVRRDGEDPRK